MTHSEVQLVKDRIYRLSGKEFQQLFWDILICHYADLQTPKMLHDLGSDGYSIKERKFFAVYAPESSKYDNNETLKKIYNPAPSKSEDLGDYDKFLKNWKDNNQFDVWVFVTKDNLMGKPHQKLVELNDNGDGIKKENWGIDKIIEICTSLDNNDLKRIFELDSFNGNSKPEEVETIMDLICYISDNAELTESADLNSVPDPDKKLERFSKYCIQIKNEIVNSVMYMVAQKEAEQAIGLDKVTVGKKVLFLKYNSRKFLRENNNDPMVSLDKMTDFLDQELSKNGKKYSYSAIRYYLISEIPKCNLFPNEDE